MHETLKIDFLCFSAIFELMSDSLTTKEVFRTCNVLPFSCTHLALWRGSKVKDPRYMQNKKDSRISLLSTHLFIQYPYSYSFFGMNDC